MYCMSATSDISQRVSRTIDNGVALLSLEAPS